jgi:hypothetical protein
MRTGPSYQKHWCRLWLIDYSVVFRSLFSFNLLLFSYRKARRTSVESSKRTHAHNRASQESAKSVDADPALVAHPELEASALCPPTCFLSSPMRASRSFFGRFRHKLAYRASESPLSMATVQGQCHQPEPARPRCGLRGSSSDGPNLLP